MADKDARLGVLVLPEHSGPDGVAIWRHVEQVGFAHAWTFDHLSWHGLRDEPWFDALTTLAAAGATTERIALGTLVATPNFRHPVLLAKQAMTIDHISGGRLVLGLGAGAGGPDSVALGGSPPSPGERSARLEEFVALTDTLLRRPLTSHEGRFFQALDVRMIPGCRQQPRVPFAVAAAGPRGMRLAVAYADTWITNGPVDAVEGADEEASFAVLRKQIETFRAICDAAGRPFGNVRRLVYLNRFLPRLCASKDRLVEALGRCSEAGYTDLVVAYPRRDGALAGDPDVLECVAAEWASLRHTTI